MQDRIGQLEKLVVELMSKTTTQAANPQPTPTECGMNALTDQALHSALDDLDVLEDPTELQLLDNFGSINLKNTSTSYVEEDHWSAILDGVSLLAILRNSR